MAVLYLIKLSKYGALVELLEWQICRSRISKISHKTFNHDIDSTTADDIALMNDCVVPALYEANNYFLVQI